MFQEAGERLTGSGLGLSSREERAGRWNGREVGCLFLLVFMLAFPSGLRPEHGGRPEEEYIAGGCGSPGYCFCGGEERVQGIWGAWAEWPLGGFGEARPASSPPSSPSFL